MKRGSSPEFTPFASRVGAAACYRRVISMEARGFSRSVDMARRKGGWLVVKGLREAVRGRSWFWFGAAEAWPLPRATGVLVRGEGQRGNDTHPPCPWGLFSSTGTSRSLPHLPLSSPPYFVVICIYRPCATFVHVSTRLPIFLISMDRFSFRGTYGRNPNLVTVLRRAPVRAISMMRWRK